MLFDTITEAECQNETTSSTTSTSTPTTTTTAATTSSTTTCAPVAIPTFDPPSSDFVEFPVLVTVAGAGTIHYTTDGSEPTIDSPVYSEPVSLDEGETIKAIVIAEGCGECTSDVAAATYNNSVTTTTSACPQEYNSVIPDITQFAVSYFAGGANLPAGLYQVTFVEGALKYIGSDDYQVNRDASHGYRVIHSSGTFQQESAPVGIYTAYATQAALESALGGDTVVFSHTGGPIGMFLADNYYGDNVAGAPNPTFLLTRLCATTTTTTPTTTTTTTVATTTTTTTAAPTTTTTTVPTTTTTTTAPAYTLWSPTGLSSNSSDANFLTSASSDNTNAYNPFGSGLWTGSNAALPIQLIQNATGAPQATTKYTIQAYNNGANTPSAWTFEGSMDGSSWTVLDTQSGITSWSAFEVKSYPIVNAVVYNYYRLNFSASNGATQFIVYRLKYYKTP